MRNINVIAGVDTFGVCDECGDEEMDRSVTIKEDQHCACCGSEITLCPKCFDKFTDKVVKLNKIIN